VLGAGKLGVPHRVAGVLAESPGELARFRCRREAVAIALEDEPGHRHAVDVIHRRRGVEALGFLVEERF